MVGAERCTPRGLQALAAVAGTRRRIVAAQHLPRGGTNSSLKLAF